MRLSGSQGRIGTAKLKLVDSSITDKANGSGAQIAILGSQAQDFPNQVYHEKTRVKA